MSDGDLSQVDADGLITMEKIRVDQNQYTYPAPGLKLAIPLTSRDKRENFLLDVSRGKIDLAKITHQNRARQIIVLMRLDLGGPAHRNPDGEELPCPHLHVYRGGYGDKWAFPVPTKEYRNLEDRMQTLEDFMRHRNITEPPIVQQGLF